MNETIKDKKYIFHYFLYGLIPLVVLFYSGEFKDVVTLLSFYLLFVILIYYVPLFLFIFASSISLSEKGITLMMFGIKKDLLFDDIDFYLNNDGSWGGIFSLSDNRITLYMKNGRKISISPKAIELFRDELCARGIPLHTEVPSKIMNTKRIRKNKNWNNFAAWFILTGCLIADVLYLVLFKKFSQNSTFLFFGMNILFAIILFAVLLKKRKRN